MTPQRDRPDIPAGGPDQTGRTLWWRLLKVEPDEVALLAWSWAYFFFLLCGYYMFRSFRDAMAAAGGIRNIKWLFLATLTTTLIVSLVFAAFTVRLPRGRFIPYAYRFFAVNLLVFFVAFALVSDTARVGLGRVFYVWTAVFSLFVVSVFWSYMADVFTNRQGRRLFGFIAVGGTLGQVTGAFVAGHFAQIVGAANLLLVAAVFLEAACWCVHRLNALTGGGGARKAAARPNLEQPIGGGAFDGLVRVARSPYLLGICLFILCYTLTSTFLYVTKISLGSQLAADEDRRVAFFASIDFWTGVVTVLAQAFLTGRLMTRLGVGATLGLLPIVTLGGFVILGASLGWPGLAGPIVVLVVFESVRRASNYAFARPAREVLYTVVGREDKYKSKNLIDTFVYRAGDQAGAWTYDGLLAIELSAAAICFAVVPLAAGWLVLALALGRRQRALAEAGAVVHSAPCNTGS